MGVGRRLYRLVRANMGHYARRARRIAGGGSEPPGGAGEAGRGSEPREGDPPGPGDGRDRRGTRPPDLVRAYALLELPWGAGSDAIRSAHRRLMSRYHPDRFAREPEVSEDATRLTSELTRARDRLLGALAAGEIDPDGGAR